MDIQCITHASALISSVDKSNSKKKTSAIMSSNTRQKQNKSVLARPHTRFAVQDTLSLITSGTQVETVKCRSTNRQTGEDSRRGSSDNSSRKKLRARKSVVKYFADSDDSADDFAESPRHGNSLNRKSVKSDSDQSLSKANNEKINSDTGKANRDSDTINESIAVRRPKRNEGVRTSYTNDSITKAPITPDKGKKCGQKSRAATTKPQKSTPVYKKSTPVIKGSAPPTKKSTPVTNKYTPVTSKSTPVARKSTPVTKKSTPVTKKSTPVASKSTPVTSKSTPVAKKSARLSKKLSTPVDQQLRSKDVDELSTSSCSGPVSVASDGEMISMTTKRRAGDADRATPVITAKRSASVSAKRAAHHVIDMEEDSGDDDDEEGSASGRRQSSPSSDSEASGNGSDGWSYEDDSEDSDFGPSERSPPKRRRWTPSTPRRKCSKTPQPPTRGTPCVVPSTPVQIARSRLHVSYIPDTLPCREPEFADIYNFIEGNLLTVNSGCMYVSGLPGTGKTATVLEVVRALQQMSDGGTTGEQSDGGIPHFTFIEVNGMRLTEPKHAYVQIWKALSGGEKCSPEHARELIDSYFKVKPGAEHRAGHKGGRSSTCGVKRKPVVLLIDELDMLWTRKQSVMYQLFDWPSHCPTGVTSLVVVAIANTMDLPERLMINRVASRLGLTRTIFNPYTYQQLQTIVTNRMSGLQVFDNDAVNLAARKVGAVSGDARRVLDICRRAAEIAEEGVLGGNVVSSPGGGTHKVRVTTDHIQSAVSEMFCSPAIEAIRHASVHEKLFLRAVVCEFQRLGYEEASFGNVYQQHVDLCRMEGIKPLSWSCVSEICNRLGAYRLLLIEHTRDDLRQRIRINITLDDMQFALQQHDQ